MNAKALFPLLLLGAGVAGSAAAANVVVGPSDCNEAGLTSALSAVGSSGTITFNCGTATIAISARKQIANRVTIDGGGTITLDGGNSSSHGYAVLGTLPAGAVSILNNGTAGNIVDFYYSYGNGKVYYSSIPLDFYLGGSGNNGDSFRNIYTPNLVAQAGALAGAVNPAVPEPATWGMMIAGFAVVGSAMRRRATKVSFA